MCWRSSFGVHLFVFRRMLHQFLLFLLKNCLWVTRSPKGYQGGIWVPWLVVCKPPTSWLVVCKPPTTWLLVCKPPTSWLAVCKPPTRNLPPYLNKLEPKSHLGSLSGPGHQAMFKQKRQNLPEHSSKNEKVESKTRAPAPFFFKKA